MPAEMESVAKKFEETTTVEYIKDWKEYTESSTLDRFIDESTGIRVWMVLALIFACMLLVTITVCCIIKIRIPRTKREIEIMSAQRKMRRKKMTTNNTSGNELRGSSIADHSSTRNTVIVMQSLRAPLSVLQLGHGGATTDNSELSDDQLDTSERSDNSPSLLPPEENLMHSSATSKKLSEDTVV